MQPETDNFLMISAPMQGVTEARWREIMASHAFAIGEFRAPFVRIEHGVPRPRDMRDLLPQNNTIQKPVPQIIFRDTDELRKLLDAILEAGYTRIDLNLGCPFPLQTARGRGAAALLNPELMQQTTGFLREYAAVTPELTFSAKIRLGIDDATQWHDAADALNEMPLCHLTIHPRTARMQYGSDPLLEQVGEALSRIRHSLIYNGDLRTPADIIAVRRRFPSIAGVMAGRGLVGRPTLFAEYASGIELTPGQRLSAVRHVMAELQHAMERELAGDSQVLQKLKPYWELCADNVPRKILKAIHKSRSLSAYNAAIAII